LNAAPVVFSRPSVAMAHETRLKHVVTALLRVAAVLVAHVVHVAAVIEIVQAQESKVEAYVVRAAAVCRRNVVRPR
jgi:hypothetical protein